MRDDQPGGKAAYTQRDERQRPGQGNILDQLHDQDLAPVGPEDAQHHSVVCARSACGGNGAEQHCEAGQHRDTGRGQRGNSDLFEDRARLFEHAADLDDRGRGQRRHQCLQQRSGGGAGAQLDGGSKIVRRIAQRIGTEHEDVVEAEAFPVDPSEVGDADGPFDTEHTKGHSVADFETGGFGEILVERNQRFTVVERAPPFAFGQFVAGWQIVRIGQPALAAQRPGAVGYFFELGGAGHRLVGSERQYRTAQRGYGPPIRLRIGGAHEILEFGHLFARNVEHEIVWGAIGHALGDVSVDCALHGRKEDEGGQAEAQRGDQRAGGRAGTMEVGQRVARNRAGGTGQGSGELANAEADQRQQGEHARCTREEARRQQRIGRCQQRQCDDGSQTAADQQQGLRVARQRCHARAHQCHCGKVPCAQQRRRGEDQGDEHAIGQRQQDRARIDDHAARYGEQALQRHAQQRHQRDADGDPREASRQRGGNDLQCIDACDIAAARAENLERCDTLPPRIEIGRHPAADADPGDHQRGEADQREKLAHPVDETVGTGSGAVGCVDVEASLGEAVLELFLDRFEVAFLIEPDAGLRLVHRTRGDQSRAHGQVFGDDYRRAELEAFAEPVGLDRDDAAHVQCLGADLDGVARVHSEPVGSAL